ncbi:MAG: hypothetical protein K8R92_03460 [Planctomycetes bacterium]|nr:hypothetical protein [Planctomycetota bacterium]
MILNAFRLAVVSSSLALAGSAMGGLITDFSGGSIAPGVSAYILEGTMWPEATYNVVTYDTIHPLWVDYYDHTYGDERGDYMIVNGSGANGGGMSWGATVAVTANTDYSLSAWFSSVYGGATSTLKFVVIGDSVMTGPNIAAPTTVAIWEQSSFAFNSGSSTSVTIQIWDVSGISDGNDYGIDDIYLDVVPAPGAFALLGLSGLVATRSRRHG